MGSIIGALIGRHLKHTEEQRQNAAGLVLPKIASYIKDPVGSPYEADEVDEAVATGIQMGLYNKEHGKLLQGQIDLAKEKRAAAKTREAMQAQTQQKQPMGVPSMNPGQPPPTSAFDPMRQPAAQPDPQSAPDQMFSPAHKSQLLQLAMAAQQQQGQGGPPDPTRGLGSPPPMTPPFVNGAGAGPAPLQGEKPAMQAASVNGGVGFGGPPPPPAQLPAPPEDFHTVWTAGPNAAKRLGQRLGQKAVGSEEVESDYFKQRYGNDSRYQSLTDQQKLELESGRKTSQAIHFSIPGTQFAKPGDKDSRNNDVEEGTPGKYVYVNGKSFFEPEPGALSFSNRVNPDGTTTRVGVNRFTGQGGDKTNPNLTSAAKLRMVKITKGDGTTHEVGVNPVTGKLVTDDPQLRGVDPAMIPTEGSHFLVVTQTDGSSRLEQVTSTSGKVLPGAPRALPVPTDPQAAPGAAPIPITTPAIPRSPALRAGPLGRVVGGRPMTPEQMVKSSQQASQLNNTIGVIKDLQTRLPMLADLVTSGKIALQVDPHQGILKSIFNKNMPLTDEEAALAADWQQMTEGIMQMRIPMGGAGFRGPEGMAAIQSLKGNLGQSTKVMKLVLDGTLREFKAQRDPLVKAGKTYGYDVEPENESGYRTPKGMEKPPGKEYNWVGSDGKPRVGFIPKADEAEFLRTHTEAKAK